MTGKTAEMIRRLRFARVHQPYTLAFAVILPIPGILAIIYGDAVSRALETLATGTVSRLMGMGLLIGGLTVLLGIMLGRSLLEATGLTVLAAGCIVYGLGVILGLGLAGAVAGAGFLAIAVGTLLRVVSLATTAHQITESGNQS